MITSSCQIEEALAQRSAARGRNRGLQTVGIGMTRTAMVTEAMNRLQSGVSPGLRPALENMVARLVGVADTAARLEFIRSIDLHDQPGEVVVSPTPPDRVTAGIVRRFTSRSRYTCHACARPGLARDDLGGAVRCPSCAAPALLRAGMRQVLVKLRRVEGLTADPEVLVRGSGAAAASTCLAKGAVAVQPVVDRWRGPLCLEPRVVVQTIDGPGKQAAVEAPPTVECS
jgi:hypothetical protein